MNLMHAPGFLSREDEEDPLMNSVLIPVMQDIFNNGIVLVCSAGNGGNFPVPHDVKERAPAGLARAKAPGKTSFPDELIVVGSVDNNGQRSVFTNRDSLGLINHFMYGEDVVAADFQTDDGWTRASGTSEATALTAGLVAQMLGKLPPTTNPQAVPALIKTMLRNTARRTAPGGPLVGNNGVLVPFEGSLCLVN